MGALVLVSLLGLGWGSEPLAQAQSEAPRPPEQQGSRMEKTLPERDENAPTLEAIRGINPETGSQGRLEMGAGSQMGVGLKIPFGGKRKKKAVPPKPELHKTAPEQSAAPARHE
jgi:hypothetical protein